MIIGFKDAIKLVGIAIVCFCAVYVCTFFLNFYLDAIQIEDTVTEAMRPLYDAQLATAKLTTIVSGGFLGIIAIIMLAFYIKLYIEKHAKELGILKSLGYSRFSLSLRFFVFALGVLIGCALGYGAGLLSLPFIYESLTVEGLHIEIGYHAILLLLVFVPPLLYATISCICAYCALGASVFEMLRGKHEEKIKQRSVANNTKLREKDRPFLLAMCISSVKSKKLLVFFVAFSCFCFSAMMQMGISMRNLSTQSMGVLILTIGCVLAAISIFMAITSLVNANAKNVAVMKSFGYTLKECVIAVFALYIPFALLGFAVGTVYQYVFLLVMVNVVFKDVGEVPTYSFDVPVFFITLALFLVLYTAVTAIYVCKLNKISVKEIMEAE